MDETDHELRRTRETRKVIDESKEELVLVVQFGFGRTMHLVLSISTR